MLFHRFSNIFFYQRSFSLGFLLTDKCKVLPHQMAYLGILLANNTSSAFKSSYTALVPLPDDRLCPVNDAFNINCVLRISWFHFEESLHLYYKHSLNYMLIYHLDENGPIHFSYCSKLPILPATSSLSLISTLQKRLSYRWSIYLNPNIR